MRHAAEAALGEWKTFGSIDAVAEATTLPEAGADLVVSGQAFHWFEPRAALAEFRRISRPGAFVALIWNVRQLDADSFTGDYDRIVRQVAPEASRTGRDVARGKGLQELFGPELRLHALDNMQELDWEATRGRLLSGSYVPLPGQAGFEPMMNALRAAFDRRQIGGRVRMDYETLIYCGPLHPGRGT